MLFNVIISRLFLFNTLEPGSVLSVGNTGINNTDGLCEQLRTWRSRAKVNTQITRMGIRVTQVPWETCIARARAGRYCSHMREELANTLEPKNI